MPRPATSSAGLSVRPGGEIRPTPFAVAVLDVVAKIPPGKVMSYGDVAEYLGQGSARTVGTVMAKHGHEVAWQRVVQARHELEAGPLPGWFISIVSNRDFHTFAAKLVIITELFIATGLWWRGTRYAAVWVAVVFHLSSQFSAAVEIFSVLGIAVLVIWAVPSTRDRVLRIDERRARWVRRLDCLARFRVEPGPRLEVVDRDGTVARGAPAAALVLSRLPLTAWFALPALLLPSVRRARRDAAAQDGKVLATTGP